MIQPLHGVRVIVGGARIDDLSALLRDRGAVVVHLPLIAERDPDDGGAALRSALDNLGRHDWLVVTSVAGAERVGDAAREHPSIRLAAVGAATADRLSRLAGRPIDVVPRRQLGSELARELQAAAPQPTRFLLALADRADQHLPNALAAAGHDVTVVTAYRTVLTPPACGSIPAADALLLTSGSTALSWVEGLRNGPSDASAADPTPSIVVAIGPRTADVATSAGLSVAAVAEDHSLAGLVDALEVAAVALFRQP